VGHKPGKCNELTGQANLAGIVLIETEAVRALQNLSPSHLIFNRNNGEVSDEIGINKSLAQTWNTFLQTV